MKMDLLTVMKLENSGLAGWKERYRLEEDISTMGIVSRLWNFVMVQKLEDQIYVTQLS